MALSIFKHIQLLNLTNARLLRSIINIRTVTCSTKWNAKTAAEDVDDPDKPIQYLNSKAAKWKAHVSRSGSVDDAPWMQSYVISTSLAIFMIYFFILREENDIDHEFGRTLYDRISGLEEKQLEIVKDYNLENNISTTDIDARLEEIKSSK